ncbi:hypothetical protein FBU30_011272 [Linnemannia zychae]|nr:hypothetical protein FBU30_011272 [Linnemannia zychae]
MPYMVLRQVVNVVCKRRNIRHPDRYALRRRGDYDLDLACTIHSAGIRSGSRLELVKCFRGTLNDALQLRAKDKDTFILAAASTSLQKVLLPPELATISFHKSAHCTTISLQPAFNNNIFTLRHRLTKSRRASPKSVPFHHSLTSNTITVFAGIESGTGVVRVSTPHMHDDHFICNYGYCDDINTNENISSMWDFDSATPSTSRIQSRLNPDFTVSSIDNNNNNLMAAYPATPSFFLPTPLVQPNDRSFSGNTCIPMSHTIPAPSLTARTGFVASVCRDGHLPSGGNGGNGSDNESNRQTPAQDISAAMIEANQEIRQRLEQQTQEALTDRVRCLSKSSDSSSDKDRFLRSMRSDSSPSKKSQQDEIVRQIALRVSRMIKEAEERGETALDYQTLIAEEIAKEQQEGTLPL